MRLLTFCILESRMNSNTRRLRANAPAWEPNSSVNSAQANLINKLTRMFGSHNDIQGETLIARQNNPVYNAPPVSEEAFNKALNKMNLNMNYNNIQKQLKEENIIRRWNEPAENIETPITNIVRNISKTARVNTNAADWNEMNKNIRAETSKSRKSRKSHKSRKANRKSSRRASRRY
jgi:hypothetical protein